MSSEIFYCCQILENPILSHASHSLGVCVLKGTLEGLFSHHPPFKDSFWPPSCNIQSHFFFSSLKSQGHVRGHQGLGSPEAGSKTRLCETVLFIGNSPREELKKAQKPHSWKGKIPKPNGNPGLTTNSE